MNLKNKETSLAKEYKDFFAPQIIIRGKRYYEDHHILSCIKNHDKFYAVVEGSEDYEYNVTIEIDRRNNTTNYHCNCPCDYPCKHIYATLMAIDHHDYITHKLKKEIKEKDYDLSQIIRSIPAKKLKEYMIKTIKNRPFISSVHEFKKEFLNYFPKEPYEYYYNNLYNAYILNKNINNYLDVYQENIKDTHNLNDKEFLLNLLLKLGMYLRIIYRKSNNKLKEEKIIPWIKEIESNNYYNNIYLEDTILSLK